jgi:hypothetical protein
MEITVTAGTTKLVLISAWIIDHLVVVLISSTRVVPFV